VKTARDFGLIIALATFWGISGYVIGWGLESLGLPYHIRMLLAPINMIVGLVGILFVTRSPRLRQIFYEGPDNRGGDIAVGCLWAVPISLFLWGLLMLIAATVSRFFTK
jgi:hypothetical protein